MLYSMIKGHRYNKVDHSLCVDLFKDVLEASIILLQDGVLCASKEREKDHIDSTALKHNHKKIVHWLLENYNIHTCTCVQ